MRARPAVGVDGDQTPAREYGTASGSSSLTS